MIRSRICRRLFSNKSPVVPLFNAKNHQLSLSNGIKTVQIKMRRPDRSKMLIDRWQHKLLSPSLWALDLDKRGLATDKTAAHDGPKPPRKMSDSYCEVLLPFRTDPELLEDYVSIFGGIRIGKLMEDLDVLAASMAYLHCDDLDLTIVTAAVDRIDLLLPIDTIISDVRLRGSVTFVGRSSVEVTISVETNQSDVWELGALAKFILVARNPEGTKAAEVNSLLLETDHEKRLFQAGQKRYQDRLRRSALSLFKMPPSEDEIKVVHDICMGRRFALVNDSAKSIRMVPMSSTQANSLRLCHPQERNIHNFMFGGYLCREALELAFTTANIFFGGRHPSLKTIDDIVFVHPVPIGSIADFKAEVIHSRVIDGLLYACVQVVADVVNPSTETRLTTNTFHFTLTRPIKDFPEELPFILPQSYLEAMKYLEGKRRVDTDLDSIPISTDIAKNPPHYVPSEDS